MSSCVVFTDVRDSGVFLVDHVIDEENRELDKNRDFDCIALVVSVSADNKHGKDIVATHKSLQKKITENEEYLVTIYLVDVSDKEPNQYFEEVKKQIDGAEIQAVIPGSKNGVLAASQIAQGAQIAQGDEYIVTKIPVKVAETLRNMFEFGKAIPEENRIRTFPKKEEWDGFKERRDTEKTKQFLKDGCSNLLKTEKKITIKPTSVMASGRAVPICNADELERYFQNNFPDSHDVETPSIICQQSISGTEFSVDMVSYAGLHALNAVFEAKKTVLPEVGYLYDSLKVIDAKTQIKIVEAVKETLNRLEIEYGPSHTDVIVTKDEQIHILYVGAHMHGHAAALMAQYASRDPDRNRNPEETLGVSSNDHIVLIDDAYVPGGLGSCGNFLLEVAREQQKSNYKKKYEFYQHVYAGFFRNQNRAGKVTYNVEVFDEHDLLKDVIIASYRNPETTMLYNLPKELPAVFLREWIPATEDPIELPLTIDFDTSAGYAIIVQKNRIETDSNSFADIDKEFETKCEEIRNLGVLNKGEMECPLFTLSKDGRLEGIGRSLCGISRRRLSKKKMI